MNVQQITSIVCSVSDFVRGKDIEDFYKPIYYKNRRNSKLIENNCRSIWNYVENHHYTTDQIILALLLQYLTDLKLDIYGNVNGDKIKEDLKLLSKRNLEKDNQLILNVCKENNLTVVDLFKIRDGGTNIVFDLLKQKFISISFIVKNMKYFLTFVEKDVIIKDVDFEKFTRVLKTITRFKGVKHG